MEDVPGSSVLTYVLGVTFTFEILSLAPMSSLAKRSGTVSVVDAGYYAIQLEVEIHSPNANVISLLLLVAACSSSHETSCGNIEYIAEATCETNSCLSFYNIFGVECFESSRLSQKNMLRINSVKEVGADPNMSVNVSIVKPLRDNSVVSESGISKASCSSKAAIPLLRAYKTCWLWMFLLIALSSFSAYSAEDTLKSEGKCRYDLTSVAALSCMQPDGIWKPPSQTCCNALLYAIDQIPGSDEGGACCLCRYIQEKKGLSGLATSYVLCNGKDKDIVSKWPMFLIKKCSTATRGNPTSNYNSLGKGIWIAIAVFSVMTLICFWYFWRSKATLNASEQRRISSYEGESRAARRRSVIPSSSLSKNVKERRFSSS